MFKAINSGYGAFQDKQPKPVPPKYLEQYEQDVLNFLKFNVVALFETEYKSTSVLDFYQFIGPLRSIGLITYQQIIFII